MKLAKKIKEPANMVGGKSQEVWLCENQDFNEEAVTCIKCQARGDDNRVTTLFGQMVIAGDSSKKSQEPFH